MKKIVLGVAALLLLGGGGAGAYFFLLAPKAEASVSTDKADDHGKSKKDSHAKSDDKYNGHGGGHTAYIELEPLLLPIIDEYGVSQTVTMQIALEIPSKDKANSIKSLKPKLNDAYIQDMYGALNEYAALRGGVLQVGIVKQRLHRVTNEVLGHDMVDAVLLKIVNQRPI